MPTWLLFLLLLIGAPFVLWHVGRDLQHFVAPDTADRAAIERDFGKDTPEAKAALSRRFGKNQHWYDASTGLLGLAGLIVTFWIVFKS